MIGRYHLWTPWPEVHGQTPLLAPHPGVTTVWLISIARWLGAIFVDFENLPLKSQLAAETIPLMIVLALSIVMTYFLLARLFGRLEAAVASLLIALDPFHISVSKTLHPDPLIAVLIMISALAMILYVKESYQTGRPVLRWVLLSGVLGGLALLTKTPGLFLLPFLLLCLGTAFVWNYWTAGKPPFAQDWRRFFKDSAKALIVWVAALAIVYFLLWPSMWVQPGATLDTTLGGTFYYTETPHENPVLFMGKVTTEDPGFLFYPVNMALKTTEIVMPFFVIGLAFVLFSRRTDRQTRLSLLLMLAVAVFFVLQMSLGAKKFARYTLPALQFIIILAGIGSVYFFHWLARGNRTALAAALSLVVLAQAAVSLPYHPFYGNHYNRFFGSPKQILEKGIVAGQEDGEGLELAADYLNSFPLSVLNVVGTQMPEVLGRYFQGETVRLTDDNVDYMFFARNWVVRQTHAYEWGQLWEEYRDRPPKFTVEFDGVTYVWVYKTGPLIEDEAIPNLVQADLADGIRLLGYKLEPEQVHPGEALIAYTLLGSGLRANRR